MLKGKGMAINSPALAKHDRPVENPVEGYANQRSGPCPVAEEVGFEPTVPLPVRRFSRPLP